MRAMWMGIGLVLLAGSVGAARAQTTGAIVSSYLDVEFRTGVEQAVYFDWADVDGSGEGGGEAPNRLYPDRPLSLSAYAHALGPDAFSSYRSFARLRIFNFSPDPFTLQMPWWMITSGGAWDPGAMFSFDAYIGASGVAGYHFETLVQVTERQTWPSWAGTLEYWDEPSGVFEVLLPAATWDEFHDPIPSRTDLRITNSVEAATSVTPEPASLALLGTGLFGLLGVARRKHRGLMGPE